ncbi:DNA polymerase III subunit delta [Adhaeribacter radiodurans]|uniref:DNA polymerase III subunit delta n=1 Tax=Adhaeribacter radiodurans TaxID=2745197 RepID=A0A7L7L6I5_9BACT|nr:DNA polymerase III subunit delta [Adhaeribacter radiodurans]QMU28418.1 DNA polymerase III subunit delta [Adhaeribacter radiodurans]
MTAEEILQKLKNKQYAPVYFLQGEEPYFIDLISNYIEQHALAESEKGFNQVILYGKDVDISTILLQAKRYPMMSERSVVIVKEAQSIVDIDREAGMKQFEAYLQNPLPSTILVFCYKLKVLDGRKSLAKAVNKHAVLLTTKKLYENQVPTWITGYVKSKNLQIQPKATLMLSEYIGADISRLANEIDKLALNLKPEQTIDERMVQENVGISKEYNIFELQTALIQGNVLKANRIIQYFEANPKNNPIIPNLTLLFSFFTKLLCLHASPDKSEAAISKSLGNRSFLVKEYQQAMRTFTYYRTAQIIHFIRVADLQSKGIEGGNMTDGEIMQELVFKILHPMPEEILAY